MRFRGKIKGKDGWVVSDKYGTQGAYEKVGGELVEHDSVGFYVRGQHPNDNFTVPSLFEGDIIEDNETLERFLVKWDNEKCGVEPFVSGYNGSYKRVGVFFTNPELLNNR